MLRHGSPTLVNDRGEHAVLPESLSSLLKEVIRNLEDGRSVVVLPEERLLSIQRAADLLGISRPRLVRLMDAGEMPFHSSGKQRRIQVRDLLAYRAARHAALDQMTRDARDAGLYDHVSVPDGGSDE